MPTDSRSSVSTVSDGADVRPWRRPDAAARRAREGTAPAEMGHLLFIWATPIGDPITPWRLLSVPTLGSVPLSNIRFGVAAMADFLATVLAKMVVLLIERLVVHLSEVVFTSSPPHGLEVV